MGDYVLYMYRTPGVHVRPPWVIMYMYRTSGVYVRPPWVTMYMYRTSGVHVRPPWVTTVCTFIVHQEYTSGHHG